MFFGGYVKNIVFVFDIAFWFICCNLIKPNKSVVKCQFAP